MVFISTKCFERFSRKTALADRRMDNKEGSVFYFRVRKPKKNETKHGNRYETKKIYDNKKNSGQTFGIFYFHTVIINPLHHFLFMTANKYHHIIYTSRPIIILSRQLLYFCVKKKNDFEFFFHTIISCTSRDNGNIG